MIKDYQDIINAACDRFNNAITQLDIVGWLENFETNDWKKALIVLNSFEYYSTKDIIHELELGLQNILSSIEQHQKVYVVAIGDAGKSGLAMIYNLKKTPSFNNKNVSLIDKESVHTLDDNCILVMVDDFAGTGQTVSTFYHSIKTQLPESHTAIALTVTYMEKAKEKLEKDNIRIQGNFRFAAFSPRGSIFGYYPKMKSVREFCFKYGDKLYPEAKYKAGATTQHPLGYLNSRSLVGFEHSIPNNTLPIIWADIKRKDTSEKWIPLFPRRGALIIERAKEFKDNQRYWTSIIFKLGLNENLFNMDEKYNKETVQLISLIYLKKKQKNILHICQVLGVNLKEYEKIIKVGQEKNLFDANEEPTDQAAIIFEEIKKKFKFQKNNFENTDLLIDEDILYLPKTFRGSS